MRIKELRLERGMKSKDVAAAIECSAVTYGRYESGERMVPPEVLVRLAKCYGVTTDYILEIEDTSPDKLSDFERDLIEAARNADKRAKEDALTILKSHTR